MARLVRPLLLPPPLPLPLLLLPPPLLLLLMLLPPTLWWPLLQPL